MPIVERHVEAFKALWRDIKESGQATNWSIFANYAPDTEYGKALAELQALMLDLPTAEVVEITGTTVIYGESFRFERYADRVDCPACNGVQSAARLACTAEEIAKVGCGRDSVGNECCARAFSCASCMRRLIGTAQAPDDDYDY